MGESGQGHPCDDLLYPLKQRVNPIIEQWLELIQGPTQKASFHEFLGSIQTQSRVPGELFFLLRVSKAVEAIPSDCSDKYWAWWYHHFEWHRLTAHRDIAVNAKQKNAARRRNAEARRHLEKAGVLEDSREYCGALCALDSVLFRRKHVK